MTDKTHTLFDLARFPENLRKVRLEKGMTYEEFAEAVGVSPRIVYDYESGLKRPRLETLVAIANALETSVDGLLHV